MSGSPSGQYDPYLGRDNDPYAKRNDGREGGIPGATAESEAGGDNSRTQALQAQIDDTVGVMRENIQKVSQRGQNLDALQDKTDELAMSAQNFRRGANRVRKQMWWKDVKMRFCIAGGIIILLAIIIIPSVLATKK